MSLPKEPFYFEYQQGEYSTDDYHRMYFSHYTGEPIVGEARHRNLFLPYVAERIRAYNPAAKVIILLRPPVERAFSHWLMWYQMDRLSKPFLITVLSQFLSFGRARYSTEESYARLVQAHGEACLEWIDRETILESGLYAESVCRYLSLFGREQVLVVRMQAYIADRIAVLAQIRRFLELDEADLSELAEIPPLNQGSPGYTLRVGVPWGYKRWLPQWLLAHVRKKLKRPKAVSPVARAFLSAYYWNDQRRLKKVVKNAQSIGYRP